MIDFENQTIGPNQDNLSPIARTEVVYITPFGVFDGLGQAVVYVKGKGLDTRESIRPGVQLIGVSGYKEII